MLVVNGRVSKGHINYGTMGYRMQQWPASHVNLPIVGCVSLWQVSDDEDDTHPNIDTASLFRWRHQARVERMETEQQEKDKLIRDKKEWGAGEVEGSMVHSKPHACLTHPSPPCHTHHRISSLWLSPSHVGGLHNQSSHFTHFHCTSLHTSCTCTVQDMSFILHN